MNCEILFRGKRKEDESWVYGWYCKYAFSGWPLKDCIIPSEQAEDGCLEHVKIDPLTVGQYTGLTDKNGVKIFEGDIVRAFIPKKCGVKGYEVGVVEFHKSAFSAVWSDFSTYGRNFIGYISDIEVIGNIHDNPELLGGNDGTTD